MELELFYRYNEITKPVDNKYNLEINYTSLELEKRA